jgi:hypothetical protein
MPVSRARLRGRFVARVDDAIWLAIQFSGCWNEPGGIARAAW